MENKTKSKKQAPVFLKILLGVIGVYLVVNFFGGVIFGKGSSLQKATANNARMLGMAKPSLDDGDMGVMSESVGMAVDSMVESIPPKGVNKKNSLILPVPPSRPGAPVPDVDKKNYQEWFCGAKS